MSDKRSERLRKRRKRSEQNPRVRASSRQTDGGDLTRRETEPDPTDTGDGESDDGDELGPSTETSTRDEPTPSEETSTRDEPAASTETSIKDEQIGTYMYLPQEQAKDLKRQYNVLKAEYEFEFEEEFEKNRHFYPLVVQYGIEDLRGLDASEIRTRLEEM